MEKFLFILITLLFTIDVQAQEEYSYNQLIAAMKCRMIKMEAVMDVKESSETFNDTDTPVRLTLVYGAQSSGYASDDYVYLMYETPDGTECKDCKGFMDYPTTKLTGKPIDGAEPYISVFYGKNQVLSIGNIKPAPNSKSNITKSYHYIQVINKSSGSASSYYIRSCDFYDISSGKERLVLKDYRPWQYDYINNNLLRVFADNMRKYYE